MSIDKTKIEKLKQLISLIDERVTRKEITAIVKQMKEFLVTLKGKNQTEFNNLNQSITNLSDKLKGDNTENLSSLKEELMAVLNKALKDQENGMNWVRDKVRGIQSGKDGKNGKDGSDGIDGKDGVDGSPDTPATIANKLEELKGERRLKIDAIDKLREELDELKARPISRGGVMGGGVGKASLEAKFIDWTLLGTGDGTTTDFIIPHKVNPSASLELKVGGANLFLTDDYTYTESTRTVSFGIAPPNSEKIRYKCRL